MTRRGKPALGYLLLALLAYVPPMLTAPGKVAADTKQYLYLDPGRLLSRSVSMWDPHVGMGTVTHQTIGYAFPMGPFYWLLDQIGSPAWVSQRLWLGSLLFAAALGVLYLLRTFGLRGPGVVVAALAYMCTPYVFDYAARISVLLMPWAALPWLIAVVRKALREKGWRYPAIFALIVQVIGGVNATALIYAGVGPVLWILYAWLVAREVDARRALGVALRIGGLTLLTSLWWISGLRMQGTYGLDVLKYSETVEAVARTSTPNEVLRGLGYWFFYGQDRLGPWIETASDYTQHSYVILAGYSLVVLSLLAAAFLRWRHRVFFVLLLFVGVVISVGAHPYDSPTPLGGLFKSFATSSTAGLALRSTGRAAPLVVLSLAVLLGLAANALFVRLRRRGKTALAYAVPLLIGVLIFVNFPALVDGTFYGKNLQRDETLPSYWTSAIAALDRGDHQTRILEEPGADFASYTWGNTVDPITPGLTDRPYVARELIPYGTPGTADLLNAIDRRIQVGVSDPAGLAALWRRMGVGSVVARNDINYNRYDLVRPQDLAAVLAAAPGLGPAQGYGPPGPFSLPKGFNDEISLATPDGATVAPVEVYPVSNPTKIVRGESTDHALMVSGDGEGLVDAAAVGLLDGAGVVRYSASYPSTAALRNTTGAGDVLVVTDNNRLRGRRWTTVTQTAGFTEQAGAKDLPLKTDPGDARLDVFPGQPPSALTTTDQVGVQRVVATAFGNTNTYWPEDRAAGALDGDLATAWRVQAFGDARGQRIQIDLNGSITTDHVNLVQPLSGAPNRYITNVVLTFDGGKAVSVVLDGRSRTATGQTIKFPRRTFHTFSVEVVQTNDHRPSLFGQADAVGFAEIRLRDSHAEHDVRLHEIIQMPTDLTTALGAAAGNHPLVFVMSRDAIRPVPPRTQPELSISRRFVTPTARSFALTGNATVSSDASEAVIDAALTDPTVRTATGAPPRVSTSGFMGGCLACRAAAAFDNDPSTAWQTPFERARGAWAGIDAPIPVTIDHLDLGVIADGHHSVPTRLRLDVDGKTRELTLQPIADQPTPNAVTRVHVTFPALRGRNIRVTIEDVREEKSLLFATSHTRVEPTAIAEFGIPGVSLGASAARIDSGCRTDLVAVDGTPVPVRVTGPTSAAATVMGLVVTPCANPLQLAAGSHVLTTAVGRDVGFSIDRLVVASGTEAVPVDETGGHVRVSAPPAVAPVVDVVHNGDTNVRVHVTKATKPFWLVLGQSQSPGWQAHVVKGPDLHGSQLVDGYANGWLVTPPASGEFDVVLQWTPQKQVYAAIWLSLIGAVVCLLIIALTWTRRPSWISAEATAAPGDADVDLGLTAPGETGPAGGTRWIAPVVCGLLGALVVAPWVGVLTAIVVFAMIERPRLRGLVMLVPAALLAVCALYIVVEQYRYRYPPVFEWPTLFPRARTLAWIAVVLLAADVIVDIVRSRARARSDARRASGSTGSRGGAPNPERKPGRNHGTA
ncbi:MAG: arabinofuranan 3-O-arabinosyltransferase [Actinomycetota bacterium]|nr:arabinofuranan 3-O-arabinosyltransferase [Actinomycetota bacterium]